MRRGLSDLMAREPQAMTPAQAQLLALMKPQQAARASKYNARKVTRHGITFDSGHEADEYDKLLLRERAGEIVPGSIRVQVRYRLEVGGVHVCDYVADFVARLTIAPADEVVMDAKGMRTPLYVVKRKLMKACHGIDIVELSAPRKTKRPQRSQRRGPKASTQTKLPKER